jgi:pyruvate kinase
MKIAPQLNFKTKILCTMGPAIATEEKIIQLIQAGASAFRLNMSHGAYKHHTEYVQIIRSAEEKLGVHVPIIADLQGPKLRVAELADGVISLVNGREMFMADTSVFRAKRIPVPPNTIPVEYPTIAKDVKKGDVILFDDGLLKVQVVDTDGVMVRVLVANGGLLKSRKGLNLPNIKVSQPALSAKDKQDVRFAIEQQCDYVALSFVRKAEDILQLRKLLNQLKSEMWIISKIEKPEALLTLEEIVKVSDAVMVARGDLGVEIPAAQVPTVQKKIIAMCNRFGKPVITATQMLESMVQNPRPTRAEASDVANAVLDGTDVVMLSAETSVGAYPIETVSYMRMICSEAEQQLLSDEVRLRRPVRGLATKEQVTDLIAGAAAQIAEDAKITAIASLSLSGETALLLSHRRPIAPIIAITELPHIARRVGLFWGVSGFLVNKVSSTDETIEIIKKELVARGFLAVGARIVITIGRPLVARSRTNMLSIEQV